MYTIISIGVSIVLEKTNFRINLIVISHQILAANLVSWHLRRAKWDLLHSLWCQSVSASPSLRRLRMLIYFRRQWLVPLFCVLCVIFMILFQSKVASLFFLLGHFISISTKLFLSFVISRTDENLSGASHFWISQRLGVSSSELAFSTCTYVLALGSHCLFCHLSRF